MRKTALISFTLVSLAACNNPANKAGNKQDAPKFPKSGTIIAQAGMPVTEDSLNHFMFSVKVIADSNVSNGIYDVDAEMGPNFATSQITLPKGAEDATPVIRKGALPYTYIIGFKMANDTTFNDLYEVSSDRKATRMRYLKSYTFESK